MIRTKKFLSLASVFITAFALLSPSGAALAQSTGGGQALEIGPPVVSITGNPGQTVEATISLRDVSTTDLYITGQINDFEANGEDGTPKVILDDKTTPYSFKSWVKPIDPLTLKPKQIKTIKVSISIPANASPGGYYGIVRFTGVPPELKGSGVSLNASLGSLIFLKVSGQAKEELTLTEFSANTGGNASSLLEGAPLNFVQRVKNTGNTFEQPVGLVTVKDMFGKVVATLPINEGKRLILSDSTRKFEQKLDSTVIGDKILFGKYTAELVMTYGTSNTEIKKEITIWIIPYKLIGGAVIALIIIFFILRFLVRRYNHMIVGRATGTKKTKKSRHHK
ncbi:MAG: hypothetical protein WAO28_02410 [Candidatus Microsaccharimonas sp.]